MELKEQKKEEQDKPSPLLQEPTYGERKYNLIFNNLINFWLNLTVSAAFTYWVTHSHTKLKLFGNRSPSEVQQNVASAAYESAPIKVFSKGNDIGKYNPMHPTHPTTSMRAKASNTVANILTLTFAGHFIMIPSVWLGAKIKAPLVEWFNRRHYGDEAVDNDPVLKARHAALAVAERPTLLGAVVGRLGTIVATQAAGYTFGNGDNLLAWTGKQKRFSFPGKKYLAGFPGMDHIAGVFGDSLGSPVQQLFPSQTTRADALLVSKGYGWSAGQVAHDQSLKEIPYKNSAQHYGKYLAQDVMYTIVTATTIAPAINLFKKFIPGLTYTPKAVHVEIPEDLSIPLSAIHVKPNRIADEAPSATAEIPERTIAGVKVHQQRVAGDNQIESLGASA